MGAGGQGSEADQPESVNQNKYISYAHAFKDHPGFNLMGFYDINTEKAFKASEAWNTDALAHWPIIADVIVIATPDATHYEQLLKATNRLEPDLVICEKPLCIDLEQAREIVQLHKDKNIPLMVDYTRRFIPELQELKHKKPKYGVCLYNRGLLHTGSHAIDFFNMLGLENYKLEEVKDDYRYWSIAVMFEDGNVWTEQRIKDDPVPEYYDNHMKYVVANAYGFLEGKEDLLCTGNDALKALERCFELIGERDGA